VDLEAGTVIDRVGILASADRKYINGIQLFGSTAADRKEGKGGDLWN